MLQATRSDGPIDCFVLAFDEVGWASRSETGRGELTCSAILFVYEYVVEYIKTGIYAILRRRRRRSLATAIT